MGDWTIEIEREERIFTPVHPGELLREEWLASLNINANQLANALGVDRQKIYDISNLQTLTVEYLDDVIKLFGYGAIAFSFHHSIKRIFK